jgi:hypothetical protein
MLPPDRRARIRRVIRVALDRFAANRKIRAVPEVHDELAAEIEKDLRLLLEAPKM